MGELQGLRVRKASGNVTSFVRGNKSLDESSGLSVFDTVTIIFVLLMKKMRHREVK